MNFDVFPLPAIDPVLNVILDLAKRPFKRPIASAELRYPVYRDFRQAVMHSVLALDLFTAVNPSIVGLVWSWPVARAAHRKFLESFAEMIVQFAEITCVGTPDVTEAAVAVTAALAELTKEIKPTKVTDLRKLGRLVPERGPRYDACQQEALSAIRRFTIVSTEDLGRVRRLKAVSKAT